MTSYLAAPTVDISNINTENLTENDNVEVFEIIPEGPNTA